MELRRESRNESRVQLEEVMARLHDLETAQATRRERVQKEEIAFGKSLLAKGFRNEDDYLSACLSEEERRALQERLRELSKAGFEIGSSQDDIRFAQAELRSLSLSPSGTGGTPANLPDLLERAGTLYLKLGSDAEGERLYREYGDTLQRRGSAGAEVPRDLDPVLRSRVRDLAFEAVLRRANTRLERGGISLRLTREESVLGVFLRDARQPDLSFSGDRLSGLEARTASLALAWGLCDLFAWQSGGTNLHVWDGLLEGEAQELSALVNALCLEGERVSLRY